MEPGSAGTSTDVCVHVVCPVHHEEDNVPLLWRAIRREFSFPFVVHFVYDREDDPTLPVLRALRERERDRVDLVHNARGGVLAALKRGLGCAPPGVPVLVIMADLSDDLALVPSMLDEWRRGATVVVASRFMPGGSYEGGSPLKKWLARAGSATLYRLGRLPVRDATNSFRLYDSDFVRSQVVESRGGFEVGFELTAKAVASGGRVVELPARYRDRTAGRSKFRLWRWLPQYARWYLFALRARKRPKTRSPR